MKGWKITHQKVSAPISQFVACVLKRFDVIIHLNTPYDFVKFSYGKEHA